MAHIFVIPGHGAGDPGAGGGGYNEAERVRALATRMKELGGDDVTLADFSRDYYKDNGISTLDIPKDWEIIELHMDASSFSARGGHVVINSTFDPDRYDNALASFISGYFPGRADIIVKRSNLSNPKRAAARGYSYRLLECCFISNADDREKFNANMGEVAAGILGAFDIKAQTAPADPARSTVFGYVDNTKNQHFIVHWLDSEWFTLEHEKTGLYLDLAGGKGVSGTNVRLYPYNGDTGQQWRLEQVPGFNYQPSFLTPQRIVPKANDGLALAPAGGEFYAGVGTKVYTVDATAAQDLCVVDHGHQRWLILANAAMLALEGVE